MSIDKAAQYLQQAQANLQNGLAELANTPTPNPPTPASTVRVKVGDNLQNAIDAATPGTTLLVAPGTYSGITLKAKQGTGAITIRPDTSNLADGKRLDPSALPDLIKLTSPDGLYVVRTQKGVASYVLRGIAPQPYGDGSNTIVAFGDDTALTKDGIPSDIVLDQWLFTADPTKGGKRAIAANARNLTVRNSYVGGFFFTADAQTLMAWNGTENLLIENNYMESSGENILTGGADARADVMVPQNITVRGNYLTKPIAWRQKQTGITTKNSLELKAAIHALIENNVIENSWSDGQVGFLVVFTTRNQDGTAPWSAILDVTFRNNVVRHGAGFVQILGLDDGKFPSVRMSGLRILNNLAYDIDPVKWNNPKTGQSGTGRIIQLSGGPDDVQIAHNTCLGSDPNVNANINSAITIGATGDRYKAERLNIRDNILPEGDYGIAGDGDPLGRASLDAHAIGALFTNNLILRGGSGRSINYGPQPNFINDPGSRPIDPSTLKATPAFIASCVTTDGKPIGCDVDALRAAIPGLDLTK